MLQKINKNKLFLWILNKSSTKRHFNLKKLNIGHCGAAIKKYLVYFQLI